MKDKILQILNQSPEGLTVRQMTELLGIKNSSRTSVVRVLNTLLEQKEVVRNFSFKREYVYRSVSKIDTSVEVRPDTTQNQNIFEELYRLLNGVRDEKWDPPLARAIVEFPLLVSVLFKYIAVEPEQNELNNLKNQFTKLDKSLEASLKTVRSLLWNPNLWDNSRITKIFPRANTEELYSLALDIEGTYARD